MISYFKRLMRKFILWLRLNLSINTGRLVAVECCDRGLGLTTMLIHKAIRNNHVIVVSNESCRETLCRMIKELYPYYSPRRCSMMVTTTFQLMKEGKFSHDTYLTDNSINVNDLTNMSYFTESRIVGGFIQIHNHGVKPPSYIRIYNMRR